jgi:hypothetical protein
MRSFALLLPVAFAACSNGSGHPAQLAWSQISAGVTDGLHGVWARGNGTVVVVGDAGLVLRTTDDGDNWLAQRVPRPDMNPAGALYGVWGQDNEVFVVGAQGLVLRSEDAGATFSARVLPQTGDLRSVWGDGAGNVWAVGGLPLGSFNEIAYVAHSSDDGASFTVDTRAEASGLFGVWGSATAGGGSELWAVGFRVSMDMDPVSTEVVLHSTDGLTWLSSDGPQSTTGNCGVLRGVWGSALDDVFAVGQCGGEIAHSGDGTHWVDLRGDLINHIGEGLDGIFGTGHDDVYAVGGTDNGNAEILHSVDGGRTWVAQPSQPGRVSAIGGSRGNSLYAVGAEGTIFRGR